MFMNIQRRASLSDGNLAQGRRKLQILEEAVTVKPRKWRIFSPAKTPPFAKTSIFKASV